MADFEFIEVPFDDNALDSDVKVKFEVPCSVLSIDLDMVSIEDDTNKILPGGLSLKVHCVLCDLLAMNQLLFFFNLDITCYGEYSIKESIHNSSDIIPSVVKTRIKVGIICNVSFVFVVICKNPWRTGMTSMFLNSCVWVGAFVVNIPNLDLDHVFGFFEKGL